MFSDTLKNGNGNWKPQWVLRTELALLYRVNDDYKREPVYISNKQ